MTLSHHNFSLQYVMPATGIEPVLCCHNRILSPARLPVPPRRHVNNNGQRRIRTFEGSASRFTVCPLWPLGNLPIKADERTRTVNLLITNQLLCQLSHIGVFCFYMLHRSIGRAQASLVCSPLIDKVNKPELSHIGIFIFIIYTVRSINGTYRARTCDPLLVRQMLSQLS